MRRFLYKLKYDTKGAVTIFFVMIIALVFAFNAVLIDYARIMSAEQQSEYALQSAVRSAMASYDNDLRDYGLFGVDGNAIESEYQDLLETNIEATSNDEAFSFTDPNVESASIDFSRELADKDILEHQILEEMKYKAPVEIAKELIEKFSFLTTAVKETSAFVDAAEKIQDDFEEREELLDETEETYDKVLSDLETFKLNLTNSEYSVYPNVNYYRDIVHHYNTYSQTDSNINELQNEINNKNSNNETIDEQLSDLRDELEDLEEDLEKVKSGEELDPPKTAEELEEEIEDKEDEIEEKEQQISDNEQTVSDNEEEIEELEQNAEIFKEQAEQKISDMEELANSIVNSVKDIQEKMNTASDLNDSIQEIVDTAGNNAEENYGQAEENLIDGPPEGVNSVDDVSQEISENSRKLQDYPYDSEFFEQIISATDDAVSKIETLPELFENINIDDTTTSNLENIRTEALEMVQNGEEGVNSGSDKLSEDRKEFENELDQPKEDLEEEAENLNDEMEELLNDAENITDDVGVYQELQGLVDKYNAYVSESDGDIPELDLGEDAKGSASSAMDIVDSIFSGIGSILADARDKLYINEYVLLYFESAEPTGITNYSDFLFENREVEYILYGQHTAGANYSMALGQLFAIRFAIRFVDAFTQEWVRSAGHPLLVFIAALSYALSFSTKDVNDMASGASTPLLNKKLTPKDKLPMVYHDYLRLFMFLNPLSDARFKRIMAVIDKKTGVDLTERQTYVKGSLETSERLIFVPQVADMLNLVGVLDGQAEDGKFVFGKEAHFSY
ncbi:hypothetical protein GI584_08700 [Gracilibacillus salitolerans]|uniref:Uncharacterized protein n=1 Tax=Gracilibacillus salitolerans TaxID=2663022 RepID=A0A5Q2TJB3_9BACI|nr:hypothetical protein [Gracilibacillus salitolerans]QGH34093.1 hypothetical protein GI584_08700 [Gracilibacillus salitolerans]